ncbi:MAG: glycosyltransferase [Negativicoccus succinicivorans]|uniref:MGDG synthase family glycosyltransferase n=1 Tax=Negativicoccus succinicivorans TaxID=620903 RepID=UPI002900232D|nr:glycosyltransferase [Negativicoccus succinicivorans]MDU2642968.1 glycosyltransferase [Negativicoccus succinicivorans]MDU2930125.1 glycosyltransferase [Negativicoccus succinicivorans]
MKYKPKVCLLSASIGQGHVQAARAVAEALKRHPTGYRVQSLDFLSRDMISLDYWMRETYIKMIDLFPLIYDLLYHQSQRRHGGKQVRSLLARTFRSRMRHLLEVLSPDALVLTHPFPAAAAAKLVEKGELHIPIVTVITDFDLHQLWVYKNITAYCVPSEQVRDELIAAGIEKERVFVTGIPIMQRFYEMKEASLREPGTVLIMGGGTGLGAVKDILWRLTQVEAVQRVIVVTGQNFTLFDEIQEMRDELRVPLELYGYTNEIPRLMARASLLVTKPGALTTTEAMTMHLPMLLVDAIPGQEEANAAHLEKIGCAKWILREQLVPVTREFFAGKATWYTGDQQKTQHSAQLVADIIDSLVTFEN